MNSSPFQPTTSATVFDGQARLFVEEDGEVLAVDRGDFDAEGGRALDLLFGGGGQLVGVALQLMERVGECLDGEVSFFRWRVGRRRTP